VGDVRISPEAEAVLDELWENGHADLVGILEDAIDWAADGDARARAHRLEGVGTASGAWLVVVRYRGEAWVVVWTHDAGTAQIHGIARTEAF